MSGRFGSPRAFGALLPLGLDPIAIDYRRLKLFLATDGFLISLSRFGLRVGFLNPPFPPNPFASGIIKRDVVFKMIKVSVAFYHICELHMI